MENTTVYLPLMTPELVPYHSSSMPIDNFSFFCYGSLLVYLAFPYWTQRFGSLFNHKSPFSIIDICMFEFIYLDIMAKSNLEIKIHTLVFKHWANIIRLKI